MKIVGWIMILFGLGYGLIVLTITCSPGLGLSAGMNGSTPRPLLAMAVPAAIIIIGIFVVKK